MNTVCPSCGEQVTQSGQRRPAVYCSKSCRRFAENTIRRLTRQLERLEDQRDLLRFDSTPYRDTLGRTPKTALRDTEKLIAEKNADLRRLMGYGDTKRE